MSVIIEYQGPSARMTVDEIVYPWGEPKPMSQEAFARVSNDPGLLADGHRFVVHSIVVDGPGEGQMNTGQALKSMRSSLATAEAEDTEVHPDVLAEIEGAINPASGSTGAEGTDTGGPTGETPAPEFTLPANLGIEPAQPPFDGAGGSAAE